MITGESELSPIIFNTLQGLDINTARTGDPEVRVDIPVYISVPEESVVPPVGETDMAPLVPGVSIIHLHNSPSPAKIKVGMDVLDYVDPNDPLQGYIKRKYLDYRQYVYQIDVYAHEFKEMIDLTEQVFGRLRRRHHALLDPHGHYIYYWLTGSNDFATKIEEERVFRRSLTYAFDAWTMLRADQTSPESVGVVEHVNTQIYEIGTGDELSNEWVPKR